MSGRPEPLYPDDPLLDKEDHKIFECEGVVYNGAAVNCFEVFEVSKVTCLAVSVPGKVTIYDLTVDNKTLHTEKVESKFVSNHMCFHPPSRSLYFEIRQRLQSIDIGDGFSRKICSNTSGICNTSGGSGTSTKVIRTLNEKEIIFPSGNERSIIVFDCESNKEIKTIKFQQGSSRCVYVEDEFVIVGGSTRFTVFDKSDFSILNTAEGSQYGFVYAVCLINKKFLVAGSYNGETYVYSDYSIKDRIKLVHRWKISNGFTNIVSFKNYGIISFKAGISLHILKFNEDKYELTPSSRPETHETIKKTNQWTYSIIEPNQWHKIAKWVNCTSKRFEKKHLYALSSECRQIIRWKNHLYYTTLSDTWSYEDDPDLVERMEFITDFDHKHLLADENLLQIKIEMYGNLQSWKCLLML